MCECEIFVLKIIQCVFKLLLKKLTARSDEALLSTRKAAWGLLHNQAPNAMPVFIVGAQRSGTNMFGDCFKRVLEIEYYPENNPIAFENYRLKNDKWVRELIEGSRYKYVLFKPLTDSHRVPELLDLVGRGKALWMFRRYEDRVNSSVKRFGDHNLRVLKDFSKGENMRIWQAQGLQEDDWEFIRQFDYAALSPESASAIFWYLRNKLYFNQELETREDVCLVCYEKLVQCAEPVMRAVCKFIGCDYRPFMVRHIFQSSIGRGKPPEIDEQLHAKCCDMYEKLISVSRAKECV